MTARNFFLFFIAMIVASACQRHYAIEDRARLRLPVAVAKAVDDFSPAAVVEEIQDIKTIYVNDSICVIQCSALFKNADGSERILDYRYSYLIDRFQSRIYHRPYFMEGIDNTLCMPDDIIKQSQKEVRKSKESVYEHEIRRCLPVIGE